MRLPPPLRAVSGAGRLVRRTTSAVAAAALMARVPHVRLVRSCSATAHAQTPARGIKRAPPRVLAVMLAILLLQAQRATAVTTAPAPGFAVTAIATVISGSFVTTSGCSRGSVYLHARGYDSRGSVLTQRELRRTPLLSTRVTKGKGRGDTSGPRPSSFPLSTNVVEDEFSEVRMQKAAQPRSGAVGFLT